MNTQGVRVRFFTTLATNILRLGTSFIAGLVIARALGPSEYGNFNFLLGSFTSFASLADMASSSAFYTFISQRRRGKLFFYYYALWLVFQFLILLLLVLFLPYEIRQEIWLGHPRELIVLALVVTFSMNLVWRFASQIGESARDTLGVQVRNLSLAVAYLLCVVVLSQFHVVSIKILFIANVTLYLLFSTIYLWRICRVGIFAEQTEEDFKTIFTEFKSFCLPLAVYTGVGFVYGLADYWLLQNFGGSTEQGYYSVGGRFVALSLIATTSIVQIFWKEIAEAYSKGNIAKVRMFYQRVSRGLFLLGAVMSCALIPFSQELLVLLLGPAYQAAWLPLSLMFLYPVHQSIGQITGIMLLATGRSKIKGVIGIFFMVVSILMAYFVLAPRDAFLPGLNLGATGLALKMLVCQLFEVNLMAYFVSRFLHIAFDWGHQLYVLILLLSLGFLCRFFAENSLDLFFTRNHSILVMVGSILLYSAGVTTLVRFRPAIAGMNKEQIDHGISWIRSRIGGH